MSSRTTYLPLASQNTLRTIITIPDTKLRGGYGVKALGGGYCTLGFTAIRAQRPAKNVFVSNSHCSRIPFSTDYAVWGQPDTLNIVGYETLDPGVRRCWKWRPFFRHDCRDSDAALISVTTDAGMALSEIGRTTFRADCAEDCSITIDTANPIIHITSTRGSNMDNDELDKIGAETGWTYGDVVETCVDKRQEGGTYILCTDMIDFKVREGDSGAPVFRYNSDGTAQLRGLVWGHDEGEDQGAISSLEQIAKNLGRLWVIDPGEPFIDSIAGPKIVPPDHMCVWSAGTAGMDPLDHGWSGVLTRNTDTSSKIWGIVRESGWLTLTVTDIVDRSAQDSISVTVDENAEKPELCWKEGDPLVGGGVGPRE